MTLKRDDLSGSVRGIVPVFQHNISCKGWENSIAQCFFDEIHEDIVGNHYKDLFITCDGKKFVKSIGISD